MASMVAKGDARWRAPRREGKQMNRRIATLFLVIGAAALSAGGCEGFQGTSSSSTGGPDSSDPMLRPGVVQLQRSNWLVTNKTIGYAATDPINPSRVWYLLSDTEKLPLEYYSGDKICIVHVSDTPMTAATLCATYGGDPDLTNPKTWTSLQTINPTANDCIPPGGE